MGDTDKEFPPIPGTELHNAHRVTEKVLSGAAPEGEAAFRKLRDLGVKTIISVDGAKPDVELARRYGLRYVHETLANGRERVCALEPDPITGPIARDILLSLRERSVIETMHDLNRQGVAGPRGGRWSVSRWSP